MQKRPPSPALRGVAALPLAAVTGSIGGTFAVWLVWPFFESSSATLESDQVIYALWSGAFVGVFALPFVSIGLVLFGLPVALLLRHHLDRPWLGGLAVLWGAIAGKLTVAAAAYENPKFLGRLDAEPLPDLGLCYGVAAGLAFWWALRRQKRAAKLEA